MQSLKRYRIESSLLVKPVISKPAMVTGLLLAVAAIALVSPWYPVTTTQVVPQASTSTYTTKFEVQTTNYQTNVVWGIIHGGTIMLSADDGGVYYSEAISLQAGVSYILNVTGCPQCSSQIVQGISQGFSGGYPYGVVASILGPGETTFVVPSSGDYYLYAVNKGNYLEFLNAIITESIPQTIELTQTQTLTTYTTTSVTQYSQATVPFYTILGAVPSVAVIGVLVIVVLFLALKRTTHRPKQATMTQFPSSCIKCGAELPPASDFCNKCGTKQT